jgi:hypothetical protein
MGFWPPSKNKLIIALRSCCFLSSLESIQAIPEKGVSVFFWQNECDAHPPSARLSPALAALRELLLKYAWRALQLNRNREESSLGETRANQIAWKHSPRSPQSGSFQG